MTTFTSPGEPPCPPQGQWVTWRVYTRDMDQVLNRLDRLASAIEAATIAQAHEDGVADALEKQHEHRRKVWLLALAAVFGLAANTVLGVLTIVFAVT